MLVKAIKYENKALARYLLPLIGAMAVMGIVFSLIGSVLTLDIVNINLAAVVSVIMMMFFLIAVVGVNIAICILVIVRFYKRMFGEEGYITNTLPISTNQKLISSLIPAVIYTVIGFLVSAVVLVLFFAVFLKQAFMEEFYVSMCSGLGIDPKSIFASVRAIIRAVLMASQINPWMCFWGCVSILVSVISNYLSFYVALAIGCSFNGNKLLMSAAVYIAVSVITSILSVAAIFILLLLGSAGGGYEVYNPYVAQAYMNQSMWLGNLMVMVFAGACYGLSYWFIEKKLNL